MARIFLATEADEGLGHVAPWSGFVAQALERGYEVHMAAPDVGMLYASFEFADGTTLSSTQLLERGFDLDGTEQDDVIIGTNTTDRINGYGGDDYLDGAAGDDVLDGGGGNNLLLGAEGNDTYLVHTQDVMSYTDAQSGQTVLTTEINDVRGHMAVACRSAVGRPGNYHHILLNS